jgi:hypothetical protein
MLTDILTNNPGIRALSVNVRIDSSNETLRLLKELLAKQRNIIHLRFDYPINDEAIRAVLTQMAINSPQLKSFHCVMDITPDNYSKLNDLLSPLKSFPHLKKLQLYVCGEDDITNGITPKVTGLEGITHLYLCCNIFAVANSKEIICAIISNMPKLQTLSIVVGCINQDVLGMIYSLKCLEHLEINAQWKSAWESVWNELVKNCKKIKTLCVCIGVSKQYFFNNKFKTL